MVFRYGIVSTNCCIGGENAGSSASPTCSAGTPGARCRAAEGEIGGNDFVTWAYDQFMGSLLHEIGHTLNLQHGGDVGDNCKPNYSSAANYDHIELQRLNGTAFIDFSPPRRPDGSCGAALLSPLAEDALDETAVLDPSDTDTFLKYTDANGLSGCLRSPRWSTGKGTAIGREPGSP